MKKVKVIDKKSELSILYERELLSRLTHPFIVNMHYAFQDQDNLYLVIDYHSGGDLRYHICIYRRFNEKQTKFIIACLILGLEYIHAHHIIHRDIKPENLVLDINGYVHITDFGVAKLFQENNYKETSGTPGYMAPEVIKGMNHSYSADYFALGVIGYEFLLGKRPYMGKCRKEIKDLILAKQARISINEGQIFNLTDEAVDFINHLLIRKPELRLGHNSINDIKEHEWFEGFNWNNLYNKLLKAPFVPNSYDNYDKKYCESIEQIGIDTQERYNIYMKHYKYVSLFRNFTYYKNECTYIDKGDKLVKGNHQRNNNDICKMKQKANTIMYNRERCQSALNIKTLEIQNNNNLSSNNNKYNYKDKNVNDIQIEQYIYKRTYKNDSNFNPQGKCLEKNNSIKNIFSSLNSNNQMHKSDNNQFKHKEQRVELSNYASNKNIHQSHGRNHKVNYINKWFNRSLSIGNFKVSNERKINNKTVLSDNNNNMNHKSINNEYIDKLKTPQFINKQHSNQINYNIDSNISNNNNNSNTVNNKLSNRTGLHYKHKSFVSRNKNAYNTNQIVKNKTTDKVNNNNNNNKQISIDIYNSNTHNSFHNKNCNSYSAERIDGKTKIIIKPRTTNNNNTNINKDIVNVMSKQKLNKQQQNELNKYYYNQLFHNHNNVHSPSYQPKKINCGITRNDSHRFNDNNILSARTNTNYVSKMLGYNSTLNCHIHNCNNTNTQNNFIRVNSNNNNNKKKK